MAALAITGYTPKLLDEVNPHPQTTTQPHRGEWSKAECVTIAKKLLLPSNLQTAEKQRMMVIQYIQFYVTGNVEDTYDVTDVVLSVAGLLFKKEATTSKDLVWPSDFYANQDSKNINFSIEPKASRAPPPHTSQDSGASTSSKSVVISIDDNDIHVLGGDLKLSLSTPDTPVVKLRPEEDVNQLAARVQPLLISYSSVSAKEFFNYCNEILARSPATDSPTREALELYRLLNFTALTMLRATTKTSAQMITGFLKRQYKTNIAAFTSPTLGEKFVPPCEACIRKVCLHVTKTRPPISSMFAKLVVTSTSDDKDLKAYLDAAVLTHTSWNGLGILQMIFDICQFFGKSWVELYHMSLISSTAHSWKAVISFLKKYQSLTQPDMTVPWARVIDDAYFMKMGPRDHPTLAALLYKSLEYSQGDEGGLDQAVWVQRHYKIVERCAAGAEYILGALNQENIVVAAGAQESKTLAKILNASNTTINIEAKAHTTQDSRYDEA